MQNQNDEREQQLDLISVNPSEFMDLIEETQESLTPIMGWGAPGCAKTAAIEQAAARMGIGYQDWRAVNYLPEDIRGTMGIDRETNEARIFQNQRLPVDGEGILNFEEMPSSPQIMQNILMNLTCERRIDTYELPAGWRVIMTGNRSFDGCHVREFSKALRTRVLHVNVRVDHKQWMDYAMGVDVHPHVIAFLSHRPEQLHDFDADSADINHPIPRTWSLVSDALRSMESRGASKKSVAVMLCGLLGAGTGVEFNSFRKLLSRLPSPRDYLDSIDDMEAPDDPSLTYGLIAGIANIAEASDSRKVAKFLDKIGGEFAVAAMTLIAAKNTDVSETVELNTWRSRHADLFS